MGTIRFSRTSADQALIFVEVDSNGLVRTYASYGADSQTKDICFRINRDENNLTEATAILESEGYARE